MPRVQYKNVAPVGDRIFVKVDTPDEKSIGGILLPSSAVKKATQGSVVSPGSAQAVKVKTGFTVRQGAISRLEPLAPDGYTFAGRTDSRLLEVCGHGGAAARRRPRSAEGQGAVSLPTAALLCHQQQPQPDCHTFVFAQQRI